MPPSAIALMVAAAVPVFFTVTTCAALVAAVTVAGKAIDAGVSVIAGAVAAAPVPDKVTTWGEPVALSAIESEAVRAPAAVGLNSTDIVQLAAAARDVVQVFAEMRKELALVPVKVSEVRARAAVPEFLMVTTWAAVIDPTVVEAKVRVVGVSVTAGVAAAPVPDRVTTCGEPVALSAIESEAVRAPAAVGLNSTETVQLAAAARDVVQVFAEMRKELELVPVRVSEVRVRAAVPEFFMVTTWAAEVDPTVVDAKVNFVGVSVTAGAAAAAPVPDRVATCGEPEALSAIDREAVNAPAAVGLNSTETVQLAAAANDVVQVFAEMRKEVALVPVKVSEVKVRAAVPEFFMVTTWAAVVDPTVVDVKVRLVGVSVTAGAVTAAAQAFTRLVTLNDPSPVVRS